MTTKSWNNKFYLMPSLHKYATEEAQKSLCKRRQYGVSVEINGVIFAYHNERVCDSCNDGCIRTKLGLKAGERTEIGAEIHAEQSMLIECGRLNGVHTIFLAGFENGQELFNPKPCPTCAKMLWYAGYKTYCTVSYDFSSIVGYNSIGYLAHSVYDLVKEYEMEARNAARSSTP